MEIQEKRMMFFTLLLVIFTSVCTAGDDVDISYSRMPIGSSEWSLNFDNITIVSKLRHSSWKKLFCIAPASFQEGKVYTSITGGLWGDKQIISKIIPSKYLDEYIRALNFRVPLIFHDMVWERNIVWDQNEQVLYLYFQEIVELKITKRQGVQEEKIKMLLGVNSISLIAVEVGSIGEPE